MATTMTRVLDPSANDGYGLSGDGGQLPVSVLPFILDNQVLCFVLSGFAFSRLLLFCFCLSFLFPC